MSKLEIGLKGSKKLVVERQHLASFTGNIGAEVLSTHQVVLLMEQASRNAIERFLPDGKMTVGTFIRLWHLAAVPIGSTVCAEAYLKEIVGRKLVFEVAAYDEFEKIAEGINEQLIVQIDSFFRRVKRKQKSA
jgi:predicted thioesterase